MTVEERLEALEKEVQQLKDVQAIKELKSKYFRALDTKNWDELETTMTPNISTAYSNGKLVFHGPKEITNYFKESMPHTEITLHQGHNPVIWFESDTVAYGKWYLQDKPDLRRGQPLLRHADPGLGHLHRQVRQGRRPVADRGYRLPARVRGVLPARQHAPHPHQHVPPEEKESHQEEINNPLDSSRRTSDVWRLESKYAENPCEWSVIPVLKKLRHKVYRKIRFQTWYRKANYYHRKRNNLNKTIAQYRGVDVLSNKKRLYRCLLYTSPSPRDA